MFAITIFSKYGMYVCLRVRRNACTHTHDVLKYIRTVFIGRLENVVNEFGILIFKLGHMEKGQENT